MERIRESAGGDPRGPGEGYLKIREQRSTGKESKTPDSVVARTNQEGSLWGERRRERGRRDGRRQKRKEKRVEGEEKKKRRGDQLRG